MKTIITSNFQATQKLGQELAKNLIPGQIICLSGDLGTGKTTFVQGILNGLGIKGPYTSPTFVIVKEYKKKNTKHPSRLVETTCRREAGKTQITNKPQTTNHKPQTIYHIDAYRVNEKDILNLGWEEIILEPGNLIVIEWAERIKKIIPGSAQWINFHWEGKERRKIVFKQN